MSQTGTLHLIGQPRIPNFADPLGLLVHCHQRIEGHLRALEQACESCAAGTRNDSRRRSI